MKDRQLDDIHTTEFNEPRVSRYGRFKVTDVPAFSEETCERVADTVLELRDSWIPRNGRVPFYSLGAVHYFDIRGHSSPPYYEIAQEQNEILTKALDWFYEEVAEFLSRHLGKPTAYPKHLGLPGFHIIEWHDDFREINPVSLETWLQEKENDEIVESPVHTDNAHFTVDWKGMKPLDKFSPLSFTLPVTMPRAGTGMYVWDLLDIDAISWGEEEKVRAFEERQRWLHHYQLGAMSLHNGRAFHQAMPFLEPEPGGFRITLQGHGLLGEGAWQLYW